MQRGKAVGGLSEKAAVHTPGRALSPGTAFSGTLIMDFWSPELGENQCLLLLNPRSVALCYGRLSRHLARGLFRSLAHFLIALFAFLSVDFKDLLYIFWTQMTEQIGALQMLPPRRWDARMLGSERSGLQLPFLSLSFHSAVRPLKLGTVSAHPGALDSGHTSQTQNIDRGRAGWLNK